MMVDVCCWVKVHDVLDDTSNASVVIVMMARVIRTYDMLILHMPLLPLILGIIFVYSNTIVLKYMISLLYNMNSIAICKYAKRRKLMFQVILLRKVCK